MTEMDKVVTRPTGEMTVHGDGDVILTAVVELTPESIVVFCCRK